VEVVNLDSPYKGNKVKGDNSMDEEESADFEEDEDETGSLTESPQIRVALDPKEAYKRKL
jgi:hypothetical protein